MASSKRQLFPSGKNKDQDSSSSETDPEDPNDSPDEELNRYFDSALAIFDEQNGEWLPEHPWNSDNKPDPNLKMKDTVAMSSTYPLSSEWVRSWKTSEKDVDLVKIEWPQDDIVTEESTIKILVVRPSEFEEYAKYCGHKVPVICLPQDEIGAGYPRYWIQKMSLRLKLQYIWMIDDSVECFYEYHPDKEPPKRQAGETKSVKNYRDYRRRQFGLVFERIEDFVQEADDDKKPIAAMSPRLWNPKCKPKKPFSCVPPQCAVYLNLRALLEKNVYYRPELKTFEDMIFGYECEQKGLKVYRDNRIMLQDHNWKDTGASSPSVKSKRKKSNEEQ